MNILSVISSTKLKEINIKGFNGFFTLNNLYYSTNLILDALVVHSNRMFAVDICANVCYRHISAMAI